MSKFSNRADELLKKVKGVVSEETETEVEVDVEETNCKCGDDTHKCSGKNKCKNTEEEIVIDEDDAIEIDDEEIITESEDDMEEVEETEVTELPAESEDIAPYTVPEEECECGEFECCIEELLAKYTDLPIEIKVILKALGKAIK